MKGIRILINIFLVVVLFSSCERGNQFTLSGKISHAEGQTIYLGELLVTTENIVDSVKIDKNGEFKFKGEASFPTFYLLKFNDRKFITLLIDSMENVTVEADYANFSREYNVEGSVGSQQVKQLNNHLNSTLFKLDSLNTLADMYRGRENYNALNLDWNEERDKIIQDQVDYSTNFVNNNPFSMASVLALYQTFDGGEDYIIQDIQTMRTAASALNAFYPGSGHVRALYEETTRRLQEQSRARVQQFIQDYGRNSPDIVLPDPDGNEVALSSLEGKVVLIQFWSAEDQNSRILNSALVEAYDKYKDKGFEIYQVSVDKNRMEWVDAIDEDNLSWTNVGDMEGCINAVQNYNVQTIPYNYLLDREGKVVAWNLKGAVLNSALENILK